LNALAADKEMVAAIGPEMVEAFTILKRAEWERYLASGADPESTEVTPWEIDYYRPFH
jgi:glutamine synthetase